MNLNEAIQKALAGNPKYIADFNESRLFTELIRSRKLRMHSTPLEVTTFPVVEGAKVPLGEYPDSVTVQFRSWTWFSMLPPLDEETRP